MINLFSPRGRIDRRTYLALVFLWLLAVALLQPFILGLPNFTSSSQLLNELWDGNAREWGVQVDAYVHASGNRAIRYSAYGVLWLAALASFLCLSAKRLHDMGRQGRYAWIGLLPFIGAQALFYVLVFLPGDEGKTNMGPPSNRNARLAQTILPPLRLAWPQSRSLPLLVPFTAVSDCPGRRAAVRG